MLQKSKSTKTHLLKYLYIIPIIGLMLTYTACSDGVKDTEKTLPVTQEKSIVEGTTEVFETETLSFAIIEKVPVFPGCSGTNEELKACFSKNITQFFVDEFNTDLSKELGLEGKVRIVSLFKVDQDGHITDIKVKAPHPELEAETKRILNALPKMTPGEHEGEKVAVMYSLPILFEVS